MNGYEKYIQSDIAWIGDIPEHWKTIRLKNILVSHKQGYYSNEEYSESGTKLLRITDIDDFGKIDYSDCPFVEIDIKEKESYQLNINDFVFARSGTIGRFGIIEQLDDVIFASYLIKFTFIKSVNPIFLKFYFFSNIFQESLYSDLHGGANSNIHAENIKKQIIPLPPIEEQSLIETYLSSEISKIDNLISNKKSQIEKLKELRQIEINTTVTKGLNPNVEMRKSDVEWLGLIPKHWLLNRLKNISYINQSTISESTHPDYEIKYIDIGNVTSDGNIIEIQQIPFYDAPSRARRKLMQNSILLSTVRTYLKAITIIPNPDENLIASTGFSVIDAYTKIFNPFYLFYFLTSHFFVSNVIADSDGVSYPAISSSKLEALKVLIPPINEQKQIVEYLQQKTSSITKVIENLASQIQKLEELRKIKIYEAVTGKVFIPPTDITTAGKVA